MERENMGRARSEPAVDPRGTDNRLTRSASVSGSQPLQHVVASSLSDRLYGRLFGDRTYEPVIDEEGPRPTSVSGSQPTAHFAAPSVGDRLYSDTRRLYGQQRRRSSAYSSAMARGVDAWLLEAYQEQLSRRPLADPPGWFYGLFFLTSLGYMSSFTMVGVLISYFNAHYGPSFFVVLSAAFYMPGIGVSYIQKRLDTFLDERLGVQSSFVVRSSICMGGLAIAMLAFPASFVGGGRGPPLMMMFLSGVLTWWSHGTASVVTLLFPPDANVALQTGFRAPELAALPLAIALHIGPASSLRDVSLFLWCSALLSAGGLVCWLFILGSAHGARRLANLERAKADKTPRSKTRNASTFEAENEPLEPVQKTIRTYLIALGVSLFCSVFQAPFYAYAKSAQGRDINEILYFARLYGDFLGRPLAKIYKPGWIVKEGGGGVLIYTLQRIVWMAFYFVYVFGPAYLIPRNDLAVVAVVAYFSFGSGYINTLTIELAGAEAGSPTQNAARKEEASHLLNLIFQCGMTAATLLSIVVAHFIPEA